MIRRLALLCAMAFGAVASADAAAAGSCQSAAASAGASKTVRLVAEYDEDDGTTDDSSGVYYFKATLRRGQSYTVWTSGATSESVGLECAPAEAQWDDDDDFQEAPSAGFAEVDEPGLGQRFVLSESEWYVDEDDPESSDPASWTYYFILTGEVGDSVTLHFSSGKVFPVGREENPRTLKPAEKEAAFKGDLEMDGRYYFKVRMTAGVLYAFGAQGGNSTVALTVSAADALGDEGEDYGGEDDEDDDDDEEDVTFAVYDDPAFADDEYNGGILVMTDVTGDYYVCVEGTLTDTSDTAEVGDMYGRAFTLVHRAYGPSSRGDDTAKDATAWTLKNVETSFARTFAADNPEDNYKIVGKDGFVYDFSLASPLDGKAVFSITNAASGFVVSNATVAARIELPKTSAPYYLTVTHSAETSANADDVCAYVLSGLYADVGSVKFAKTSVTVKESAVSAEMSVSRTKADGRVRVRYETVDVTAEAGTDYARASGVLEWADGDKKAKKIAVRLIPELVPVYDGEASKSFVVRLSPMDADELEADEYPAVIAGGRDCTVSIAETSKKDATVESVYAAKGAKRATVKTEDVPLSSGTFYGVLMEDGCALTNGMPRLASVTFTVSTAATPALSAKAAIAGKTHSFSAKGWDEAEADGVKTRTLTQVQKVAGVVYTNVMEIAVREGGTVDGDGWLEAGADVVLTMNVPDANGKGVQEEIVYSGTLARGNAKIQGYLDVAQKFAGYYTMALMSGEDVSGGRPAGHGYLTVTVDNKGTAKVAGMLADGKTKISVSSKACAIRADGGSANGYSMEIPVHHAKSSVCFGGTLRLYAVADEAWPDETGQKIVVDSSSLLLWCNDLSSSTYWGDEGYDIWLAPCGGWYDKVFNLQAYYLGQSISVATAAVDEFPAETLADGYAYSTIADPNGLALEFNGDKVVYDKKKTVKSGKLVDLENSTNVCNVSVKFTRATGLFTGGCSLWSESDDGAKQKEVSGFKAYGVFVLAREEATELSDEILAPGFLVKSVKLVDEDGLTGRRKSRTWTFSAPFCIMGEAEAADGD